MESTSQIRQKLDQVSIENSKYGIYFLFGLFAIALFLGGILIGHSIQPNSSRNTAKANANQKDLDLLYEVWGKIDNEYINEEVDQKELTYGTIRGLVSSLGDKYSMFLDPEEVGEYENKSAGIFEGIGTTLRYDGEFTVIETPMNGFPAQKSGLMPRDIILEVNSEDMSKKNAQYVASKILGEAGTNVHIKIYRESDAGVLEFDIVREKIDFKNLEYKDLGNGIYQIQIFKFTEDSLATFENDWDKIVNSLVSPKGIILDLRNNPGGYVQAAEYVSNEFLPRNTVLFIEEDRKGGQIVTKSSRNGKLVDVNLVVLINGGSASASEIVTGALRDNGRATLVGETTLGKGVEQKIINLSGGSELHLVFKKWLTPKGQNVTFDEPIKPDVEVPYATEDFKKGIDPQLDKAIELLSNP